MAADPVTAIANAIAEFSKAFGTYMATRRVRHMKAAIDAAERYIFVNERLGENADLTDEKQKKLLTKFRKRFFCFN
jgi:ribosomal protein L16 Arg81 hydroxylase